MQSQESEIDMLGVAPNGVFTRSDIKCWYGTNDARPNKEIGVIIIDNRENPRTVVWGFRFRDSTSFLEILETSAKQDFRIHYGLSYQNIRLYGVGVDMNADSRLEVQSDDTVLSPYNQVFNFTDYIYSYSYKWKSVDTSDIWFAHPGGTGSLDGTTYWTDKIKQTRWIVFVTDWTPYVQNSIKHAERTYTALPPLDEISPCPVPKDVNYELSAKTISLNWTDVGSSSWYVYYKASSAPQFDSVLTTNTYITLSDLEEEHYEFYIRSVCSADALSLPTHT